MISKKGQVINPGTDFFPGNGGPSPEQTANWQLMLRPTLRKLDTFLLCGAVCPFKAGKMVDSFQFDLF